MSLLKREADCLDSEVNGWARVSYQPALGPMFGAAGGDRHGAAAVLACVWPLAALVVEFVTIPPVPNPPAALAAKAPTPSAAALAVLTAAADHDSEHPSRLSDTSLICPSPIQGLITWLDKGMDLPLHAAQPSPSPLFVAASFPRMSSPLPPTAAPSAVGWRAWELLDAVVDLVGPTGDTLLWDARYRHSLSAMGSSNSAGIPVAGAVDPAAAKVLDWGRRQLDSSDRRDDARGVREGKKMPGTPARARGSGRGDGVSDTDSRGVFIDAKGKENPLADAGGVPWMLVRLLLAIFVSGGAAKGPAEVGAGSQGLRHHPSDSTRGGGGSSGRFCSVGSKGGGGTGSDPPSIALVALQRLIALLNSLEASGYKHYEFEVLHVAARVSTALRTTCLTPLSAWVLGALQLLVRRAVGLSSCRWGFLVFFSTRRNKNACTRHGLIFFWGKSAHAYKLHARRT